MCGSQRWLLKSSLADYCPSQQLVLEGSPPLEPSHRQHSREASSGISVPECEFEGVVAFWPYLGLEYVIRGKTRVILVVKEVKKNEWKVEGEVKVSRAAPAQA